MPQSKVKQKKKNIKTHVAKDDSVDDKDDGALRKDLIWQALDLKKLLQKEAHEKNELQNRKEKILHFRKVQKERLKGLRTCLLTRETEITKKYQDHDEEMARHKQLIKHMLFEHQHEHTNKKAEAEVSLSLIEKETKELQAELKAQNRQLESERKEKEVAHIELLKGMRESCDRRLTNIYKDFMLSSSEVMSKSEHTIKTVCQENGKAIKVAVMQIDEKKNAQVAEVMASNEKELQHLKSYFNDLTDENMNQIKSLKDELIGAKKNERNDGISMRIVTKENCNIAKPLEAAKNEICHLNEALTCYEEEKSKLHNTRELLNTVTKENEDISWQHEVLLQRFHALEKARNEHKEQLREATSKAQQRSCYQNLLLEKKLTDLLCKEELQGAAFSKNAA